MHGSKFPAFAPSKKSDPPCLPIHFAFRTVIPLHLPSHTRICKMSRLGLSSRFIRLMHTSGRQVPHPGQGGAPQVGTTSPSAHSHLPASTLPPGEVDPIVNEAISHLPLDPSASSASSSISNTYPAGPGAPTKFTPKGRAIPVRPARSISVNLPSGYPETSSYPVTQEYVDSLQAIEGEIKPHTLWQFFQ